GRGEGRRDVRGRGPNRPPRPAARRAAAARAGGHRPAVRPLPERLRTEGMTVKIWFLTGSQGLYGEATLRQVAEQSQRIAAELNASLSAALGPAMAVEVEWRPVLTEADAIRRACLE